MDTHSEVKTVHLLNGETYAYREAGNASRVLLLVHGAFASSLFWASFMSKFADEFRVIAVDLRGHGYSSYNTPPTSLNDLTEDLKLFVDVLGLSKFFLMG